MPHLPEQTHPAELYLQNTAFASSSFGNVKNTENSSSGNSATVVLVLLLSSLKRGCACEPCWSLHSSTPPLLAPVLCSGVASLNPVIPEYQDDGLELPLLKLVWSQTNSIASFGATTQQNSLCPLSALTSKLQLAEKIASESKGRKGKKWLLPGKKELELCTA